MKFVWNLYFVIFYSANAILILSYFSSLGFLNRVTQKKVHLFEYIF